MDLAARMKGVAQELRDQYRTANPEQHLKAKISHKIDPKHQYLDAFLEDYKEALRRAGKDDAEGDWAWVRESAIMDDLCADFMAPTLRGALMPLLSRGASLRLFWRDQFQWNGSNDRGGYAGPGIDGFAWKRYPLVIFNASDAERGSRLAFGFPPLPPGFRMSSKVEKSSLEEESHHPPQTLADLDPDRSIDLHQAVALSANFPLGFTVLTIPRHNASARDSAPAKILDGGIVDNTGIDSLFLILRGLKEGKEAGDGPCGAIWSELDRRRVLLIEINSGRKPAMTASSVGPWISPLYDPSTAQKNARFDHAELAKQHYRGTLREWLRDRELPGLVQQVAEVERDFAKPAGEFGDNLALATGPLRKCLEKVQGARDERFPSRFTTIRIECTHLGQSNVQTAWSLGPEDKARVLVRFLVEMHMHREELKQWASETTRQDADDLVKEQWRAFFCPLLGKSLAQASAELRVSVLLGKEGAKSRIDLQARLERIEARLAEAERMAGRFGINVDVDVAARLKELRKAIRASQDHLRVHESLTAAQLELLDPVALDGALKQFEPRLQQVRAAAEGRVKTVLPRVQAGVDWQTRFNLRATLSWEMHARAVEEK